MKRSRTTSQGSSFGNDLMSSRRKRQALGLLLEELSKPEIDIPTISNHTSSVMAHMKQRNMLAIPMILDMIQKQNEPLVLEITQKVPPSNDNPVVEESAGEVDYEEEPEREETVELQYVPSAVDSIGGESEPVPVEEEGILECDMKVFPQQEEVPIMEEQYNETANYTKNVTAGGKQFEIIFADSTRPNDIGSEQEHHIIHSTTERSATSSETAGTVNVPNSFPLFQLVHAGEVPEAMQREIEHKIRQANPELDLNSITFKFKSPETVEIIANVNT